MTQMTFDEILTEEPEQEGDNQEAKEGTDETTIEESDLEDADNLEDEDDPE